LPTDKELTETYGHHIHTSDQEDHQTSDQEAVPEDPVVRAQRILAENQEEADARPDLAAALLALSEKQQKMELQLGSLMAKRAKKKPPRPFPRPATVEALVEGYNVGGLDTLKCSCKAQKCTTNGNCKCVGRGRLCKPKCGCRGGCDNKAVPTVFAPYLIKSKCKFCD
jgi:hypothetical protein